MSRTASKSTRPPLWLAALLILSGGMLLLHELLLLEDINLLTLLPLLLVVLGVLLLVRGDLVPSQQARAFRITRGNVEHATLAVNSGEIDVRLYPLPEEAKEYLVAGQYAPQARPQLVAEGTQAYLTFDRAQTRWLHWADWEIGLAQALPWELFLSASLGQIEADCTGLIVSGARLRSGFGDLRFTCPLELLGDEPIDLYAALGSVQVLVPQGYNVQVTLHSTRFFKAHVNTTRFVQVDEQTYAPRDANPNNPPVAVSVRGAFGDAYLA